MEMEKNITIMLHSEFLLLFLFSFIFLGGGGGGVLFCDHSPSRKV